MRKRIELKIAGQSYFVLGDDSKENHLKKVESIVDDQVTRIRRQSPSASTVQSVIMAACNIADDCIQANEAADNLRMQMKNYLEEAASLRRQIDDMKKELEQAKQGK